MINTFVMSNKFLHFFPSQILLPLPGRPSNFQIGVLAFCFAWDFCTLYFNNFMYLLNYYLLCHILHLTGKFSFSLINWRIMKSTNFNTWYSKFHCSPLAKYFCTVSTVFHGHTLNGNERTHIQCPKSPMFSLEMKIVFYIRNC